MRLSVFLRLLLPAIPAMLLDPSCQALSWKLCCEGLGSSVQGKGIHGVKGIPLPDPASGTGAHKIPS